MAGLTGFGAANLGHGGSLPSHMGGGMVSPGAPHAHGGSWPPPQQQQQQTGQGEKMPYVKIIEQPAENKLRFRYECEGRSAGALHGVSHTNENKTFPTIQVVGYKGPAVVVVSCVEDKPPYRTHPHNLVGKDGMCKKGHSSFLSITYLLLTYYIYYICILYFLVAPQLCITSFSDLVCSFILISAPLVLCNLL